MSVVAVREAEIVPSLEELTGTAVSEHQSSERNFKDGLRHALLAGNALLAIRAMIPHGEWESWCESNPSISPDRIKTYVRLATYADVVRDAPSVNAGIRLIASEPWSRTPSPTRKWTEDAIALRDSGMNKMEIAKALGVSRTSVHQALHPDYHKQQIRNKDAWRKRRKQEAAALVRENQAKAAKSAGVSEQWATLLRLREQMANIAAGTGSTPAIRAAFAKGDPLLTTLIEVVGKVLGEV